MHYVFMVVTTVARLSKYLMVMYKIDQKLLLYSFTLFQETVVSEHMI